MCANHNGQLAIATPSIAMVMPSSEAANLSSRAICHPILTSQNNFYLKDNLGIMTSTNLETSEFDFYGMSV
jgi:hypothetical protein